MVAIQMPRAADPSPNQTWSTQPGPDNSTGVTQIITGLPTLTKNNNKLSLQCKGWLNLLQSPNLNIPLPFIPYKFSRKIPIS